MKLKKILCVFLFSGLLAGSVNMTAFAKETDEKYDYAKINDKISAIFGSDSEKSTTGISVDTIKKAYEDIRDKRLKDEVDGVDFVPLDGELSHVRQEDDDGAVAGFSDALR